MASTNKPTKAARARALRLLRLFGLTPRDYEDILAQQNGVCAICLAPPKKVRLGVDHRHKDGLIRGLLCWSCNKAISYVRDSPPAAQRLAEYLKMPPAIQALGRRIFGRTGRVSRKFTRKEKKAWKARTGEQK